MMKRLMKPESHCTVDYVSLKEFIIDKFETMEKAVITAKDALDLRLEGMNEFRKQMAEQAANFMPRSEYLIQHKSIGDRVDALQRLCDDRFERLDKRVQLVELVKSNIQGRIWATAVMVTLIIAGVQVVIQVLIHVFMGGPK